MAFRSSILKTVRERGTEGWGNEARSPRSHDLPPLRSP
jgi:hypothetical protein